MTGERNRRLAGLAVVLTVVLLAFGYYNYGIPWRRVSSPNTQGFLERDDGYFTVQDENARTLFTTGHMVAVGDEFIDADDVRYIVERISGDVATARQAGKMEALSPLPLVPIESGQGKDTGTIGIYHTHSDESYEPTDGTSSIDGRGGVLRVGETMANKLDEKGLEAVHDDTLHGPHDAGAYERSRRTAAQLMKERPLALFDVHRDAGPAEPYLKDVDGNDVARCMIVVGRTNPKMSANLDFARRMRDAVNAQNSGLVKGIFLGNADFNQDLYDRALLLEVGTEKVSREAAERGVALVASAVPRLLGSASQEPGRGLGGGTGRAIGWILGLAVAGTFVYLWIATGSWEEMKAKILGWFGTGGVRIGGRRGNGGSGEA